MGISYIPNTPLETQVPISGNVDDSNIFEQMANLSPYFPNPRGFGVDEYAIPPGSNVTWLNMVHRHGSRYPEANGRELALAKKLTAAKGKFIAHGPLSFLNEWESMLGAEILVPLGKQQLFDSGVLHYYQYGHLYPNNGSKIVARSTTQQRMLESAEYFLAGFFGLAWTRNASLELVVEGSGFNNTLAGYKACNRSSWDMAYESELLLGIEWRFWGLIMHSCCGVGEHLPRRRTPTHQKQHLGRTRLDARRYMYIPLLPVL